MPTIREATFDLLRRHQMTMVFGNPGSNELLFLTEFPEDFTYILGLHEGAVMAMADGYAQSSQNTPLVSLHSAAGLGTAMGILANTTHSKSPVVLLSGQQIREMVGQDIMVASSDAASLPAPFTKWSTEPLAADDVVRSFAEAIHLANLHPKGPTHISVPYDDWNQESTANAAWTVNRQVVDAMALSESALDELTTLIDDARSPVLVLGPEVDATNANDDAVSLAEALDAPAWIAPSPPRCPFPTKHRLFAGLLPASVAGVADNLEGHDLVIVVGAPVFRYHHNYPGSYLNGDSRLVHISQDPSEVARAPFGDAYLAPVQDTLARLAKRVRQREVVRTARAAQVPGTDRADRMHPDTVFRLIDELTPADVIHVVESTSTANSFCNTVDISHPGSYFSAAAGGLGFGLPAAIGVQLAQPRRQVVASIGDGSANYGITALWTAARHEVPVVFVILRNGTYGALVSFGDRLEATNLPSFDLPGIDFVDIARGYGVPAYRACNADELRSALTEALASGKPALIEALTFHN